MSLATPIAEHVRAGFSGIYVRSFEHEDAIREIARLCHDQSWQFVSWNVNRGLGAESEAAVYDPLAAVRILNAIDVAEDSAAILVLENFHHFLSSAEVVQAVADAVQLGKTRRTFLVILAPEVELPAELEKLFVTIQHALPDQDQLEEIARGIATEADELPDDQELDRLLEAAAGLTRYEAEGAFSLALVRHGRLEPTPVWELKAQALEESGLLSLHRGAEFFGDLGGLDALKNFCARALGPPSRDRYRPHARGVMLLGVPGTGKSAFAKALGNETNRPTLVLDVGTLLGSLVGQTESRTRQALEIVDAMAPCVLFIDELEKSLAGSGGAAADSGVSSRMLGTLLSWLNDHTSDVFVCCTANDVAQLPPELLRAERFDAVYFLDLPKAQQRQSIWQMYQIGFDLKAQSLPADEGWTGAEIASCCRLAALLDVPLVDAAQHVVPVAATAAESIERLRNWASGRCLDADRGGVYRHQTKKSARRRAVNRDPSAN